VQRLPQMGETVRTAYNVVALVAAVVVIYVLLRLIGWV
jgi:hypothetical protein